MVKDHIYSLQQNDNKRLLIHNSDNLLIATKPYTIDNKKVIS